MAGPLSAETAVAQIEISNIEETKLLRAHDGRLGANRQKDVISCDKPR